MCRVEGSSRCRGKEEPGVKREMDHLLAEGDHGYDFTLVPEGRGEDDRADDGGGAGSTHVGDEEPPVPPVDVDDVDRPLPGPVPPAAHPLPRQPRTCPGVDRQEGVLFPAATGRTVRGGSEKEGPS